MAPDVADLFGPLEELGASPCDSGSGSGTSKPLGTDSATLTSPDLPTSHSTYPYTPGQEQRDCIVLNEDDAHDAKAVPEITFRNFNNLDFVSAPLHFATPALYTSQPDVTTINPLANNTHSTNTIPPLQTRFDSSFKPEPGCSTDPTINSATSSHFEPWADIISKDNFVPKIRRSSMSADIKPGSRTVATPTSGPGRRRKSENLEPGSARAVYLEKNRQAASKCRSKQKKQHEELVETAREVERKNKMLKAEVEYLKGDMRELMEIVGRHAGCPDNRLQTYVQREADRLVAGAGGNTTEPGVQMLTPKSSVTPDKQ